MANTLIRRKTTIKPNLKPVSTVKEPKKSLGVEFRWSTSIHRLNLIDLDNNTPYTNILSIPSTKINNAMTVSHEKSSSTSPRLPNINDSNKKNKLSLSSEENMMINYTSPLSLTYAQLHHAQFSPRSKKKSQSQTSLLPVLNTKRNNPVNQDIEMSNQDKYIRLHTSQLRRLHVSSKYIKEAKKLYFNAASKIFVPRHAIVEMI